MPKRDRTSEYVAWVNMRQRCLNPQNSAYKHYGARGIMIDRRWDKFDNFLVDMGPKPVGMTLERVDNSKGYGPDNCIWTTQREQMLNTRRARPVTFAGKTQRIDEWASELEICAGTLWTRLQRGWSIERTLTEPPQNKGRRVHNLRKLQHVR